MIIIKIIILYFIQIRHTDDFPSTGTRLVFLKTCMILLYVIISPHIWRHYRVDLFLQNRAKAGPPPTYIMLTRRLL